MKEVFERVKSAIEERKQRTEWNIKMLNEEVQVYSVLLNTLSEETVLAVNGDFIEDECTGNKSISITKLCMRLFVYINLEETSVFKYLEDNNILAWNEDKRRVPTEEYKEHFKARKYQGSYFYALKASSIDWFIQLILDGIAENKINIL